MSDQGEIVPGPGDSGFGIVVELLREMRASLQRIDERIGTLERSEAGQLSDERHIREDITSIKTSVAEIDQRLKTLETERTARRYFWLGVSMIGGGAAGEVVRRIASLLGT
jgi:50S ribosomal subunit-associated GTPase HflX